MPCSRFAKRRKNVSFGQPKGSMSGMSSHRKSCNEARSSASRKGRAGSCCWHDSLPPHRRLVRIPALSRFIPVHNLLFFNKDALNYSGPRSLNSSHPASLVQSHFCIDNFATELQDKLGFFGPCRSTEVGHRTRFREEFRYGFNRPVRSDS